MIKTDSKATDSTAQAKAAQDAQSKSADTPAKLMEEADQICVSLENFFKRAFGDIPKSTDLGEIRAHQSTIKNLVQRAAAVGGGKGGASEDELAAITAERDKLKDAAARARADFLNFQTRSAKDLERAEELALRGYVSELLPILDSFDFALMDAKDPSADITRVREALDMINQSFKQVLSVRGLTRIEAKGKTYDPTQHEAVVKRPADASKGEKPNMVLEELRPGYLWKGLVLRPAQVLVAEPEKK